MSENKNVEVEEKAVQAPDAPENELLSPTGEELLFPDGPTISLVEEWKARFGEIYLTEFGEDVYIWRTLLRPEYKGIVQVKGADSYYKEERITEAAVLWPEGYNFESIARGKAGIPSLISELVIEKSGFQATTGAMQL